MRNGHATSSSAGSTDGEDGACYENAARIKQVDSVNAAVNAAEVDAFTVNAASLNAVVNAAVNAAWVKQVDVRVRGCVRVVR